MQIRACTKKDWVAIAEIYKEGIQSKMATFETIVPPFDIWNMKYMTVARLVCELNNSVIAWAALSAFSKREVYRGVAEVSIYVAPKFQGKGVATALLKQVVAESEDAGIWSLQSSIFPQNTASIALHKKMGFRTIGYRERIAQLHGSWYDNIIMERRSSKIGL